MSTASALAPCRFEGFILDMMHGALSTAAEEEVALFRRAFQLLRLLVEDARRLLDRDDINQTIWPDVMVSDDREQVLSGLRLALDKAPRGATS